MQEIGDVESYNWLILGYTACSQTSTNQTCISFMEDLWPFLYKIRGLI